MGQLLLLEQNNSGTNIWLLPAYMGIPGVTIYWRSSEWMNRWMNDLSLMTHCQLCMFPAPDLKDQSTLVKVEQDSALIDATHTLPYFGSQSIPRTHHLS